MPTSNSRKALHFEELKRTQAPKALSSNNAKKNNLLIKKLETAI
ncbi:hypothetical protein [Agarivorans sp. 1_MG-2023]|nr:hypothetical protein [Agarivorans sp. 1_MG-2023]MDO6766087.1 hypothetical protein [Agarivorans sp. 1_MG-2023]